MPDTLSRKAKGPTFYGYPTPLEAPNINYENTQNRNPVLRGIPLIIIAWIVSKLTFIQKYLWTNAGFGVLRKLRDIEKYGEIYNPTVIPLSSDPLLPLPAFTDADSFKSLPKDLSGRYYSVADFHALYISGELTPIAVVESLLPLIRRDVASRSSHSVAFTDNNTELILRAARESTQRYKANESLGLLDGIPIGVKDEVDVAGYRTHSGREANDTVFEIKTATIWPVQKWQEAGAIIIGKTNMHELGSDTSNNNPNWGTPRNPHNSWYYTGGSSGGSAYAVSAGLVPIALGTDGGGSIRIPSSFCGVYGLKPSHSRVGDYPSTVVVIGPLAATISDLEVAYRVMAYPDTSHSISSMFSQPRPIVGNRPRIMGIYKPWFDRADLEVKNKCDIVVDYLKGNLGYEVVEIEIPHIPEGQKAHAVAILTEMASHAKASSSPSRHLLTDITAPNKVLLTVATQTPVYDYILAQKLRHMLMSHLAFLYQKYPGLTIVTPTSPIAGWPIEQEIDLKYGISDANMSVRNMEYIWIANFTGCPAITCPVGYVSPKKGTGDIPVGIMAMGEWGCEDTLIEWGRDVEKWLNDINPSGRKRPAVWEDILGSSNKTSSRAP